MDVGGFWEANWEGKSSQDRSKMPSKNDEKQKGTIMDKRSLQDPARVPSMAPQAYAPSTVKATKDNSVTDQAGPPPLPPPEVRDKHAEPFLKPF